MYYRGTLEEFNVWHNEVILILGLPLVGYVNGVLAPQNQETVAYSQAIKNPNGTNDYIWSYGAYPIEGKVSLSQSDINSLNWFAEV